MSDSTADDKNITYVGLWFSELKQKAGQCASDFESPLSYLSNKTIIDDTIEEA